MSVYSWLVVLILLAGLLLGGNTKRNKKFIIVAFLLMFCVMGLRDAYSVGNDSATSYWHQYKHIEDTDTAEETDDNYNFAFNYVMKVIYNASDGDYQFFLTLVSAFILLCYVRFVWKYSPSPLQSILYFFGLLYFTFMFDALKQAIAMSILLFAFDAIIERRAGKFVVMVLLAACFHYPALIFLPAYWIAKLNVNRSYLLLLAILLAITYFLRDEILNLMIKAYGGDEINSTMDGITFLRNKVIVMIVIVVAALILRPYSRDDVVYNTLLKFMGMAIIFQTFCGYDNIFERLADYYFVFSMVFIPMVFDTKTDGKHRLEEKSDNLLKNTATLTFCGFAIWRFITVIEASSFLMPYKFFFQSTLK